MGCDIHAFIEKREGTTWWQWAEIVINRYYSLFSLMAGVRMQQGDTFLFKPKGIPDILGIGTKEKYYKKRHQRKPNPDWHTPSWLNLEELCHVQDAFKQQYGVPNDDLSAILAAMNELQKIVDDVRLVFWFDN